MPPQVDAQLSFIVTQVTHLLVVSLYRVAHVPWCSFPSLHTLHNIPHSHETKTPLSRSGRQKPPWTISSLKKDGILNGTFGHELSRPKRVS